MDIYYIKSRILLKSQSSRRPVSELSILILFKLITKSATNVLLYLVLPIFIEVEGDHRPHTAADDIPEHLGAPPVET